MTNEDIIRMAVQCQLVHAGNREGLYMDALAEFAALVAAAEREVCAKVCEEVGEHPSLTPRHCAEAIRERGVSMTINDFIRMAHEAGWQYADGEDGYAPLWDFGKLVEAESAATEREAIIRLLDEMRHIDRDGVIDAIRAKGQA